MHEMSIASEVLRISLDTMSGAGGTRIGKIGIEIGALAGVETEALRFCFDAVVRGTPAEGAILEIETVEAEAFCDGCGAVFIPDGYVYGCPSCGEVTADLRKGRELRVSFIDTE